jgi:hypothetical protein
MSFLKIAFLYLIVLLTYSIILFNDNEITALGIEDGPIEILGAIFFLLAASLFIAAYIYSSNAASKLRRINTHKNLFYLLLGVLFLVCSAEEISWGQRIYNWETPELFKQINVQRETNLHNILLFDSTESDSSRKSTMHTMLFNMNRLFAIFWLSFCVIVPITDRLSLRMRNFFKTIGLPITPLWIGMLFVIHAIVFQIIYSSMDLPHGVRNSVNELKESNYAFIFTILAYYELKRNCKQSDFLSK